MRRMIPLLIATAVLAQTPAVPRLYTYYRMPTDSAWQWKSVVIDPPLQFALDANGQAHLSAPNCYCVDPHVEAFTSAAAAGYTLRFIPSPFTAVYVNGLLQLEGRDYSLTGTALKLNFDPGMPITVQVRYVSQCGP